MKKYISGFEIIVGIVFVIIGYVYITTPARLLPQFLPGYDAVATQTRYVYGAAALILGLVAFVMAAFKNPKRADN